MPSSWDRGTITRNFYQLTEKGQRRLENLLDKDLASWSQDQTTEGMVLTYLDIEGGVGHPQLATELNIPSSSPNLVSILRKMENQGYLEVSEPFVQVPVYEERLSDRIPANGRVGYSDYERLYEQDLSVSSIPDLEERKN